MLRFSDIRLYYSKTTYFCAIFLKKNVFLQGMQILFINFILMKTYKCIFNGILVLLLLASPLIMKAQGVLPESGEDNFIVVIDPGHGGFDPGARGRYSTEKEIALSVSLKTGKLIDQIPGVKVIYTRTTDILPGNKKTKYDGLHYRAIFANKVKGNVFISIHCNSARNRNAEGTEVYVWGLDKNADKGVALRENAPLLDDPEYKALFDSSGSAVDAIFWNSVRHSYMQQSLSLAADVENQFAKLNRISRSVKQRKKGIWVLHATAMPSILIETGFISNPKEEKYLNNHQDEIAESIYKAFVNYLAGLKGLTGEQLLAGKPGKGDQNTAYPAYHYKIQLLASSKKMDLDNRKFKKLDDPVERKFVNVNNDRIYRYLLGNYKTYQDATNKLSNVKLMGYKDAFIVTYKNNQRLDD